MIIVDHAGPVVMKLIKETPHLLVDVLMDFMNIIILCVLNARLLVLDVIQLKNAKEPILTVKMRLLDFIINK